MFIVINNIRQTKRPNSGAINMVTGRITTQYAAGKIYVRAFALLRDKYILPGTGWLFSVGNCLASVRNSSPEVGHSEKGRQLEKYTKLIRRIISLNLTYDPLYWEFRLGWILMKSLDWRLIAINIEVLHLESFWGAFLSKIEKLCLFTKHPLPAQHGFFPILARIMYVLQYNCKVAGMNMEMNELMLRWPMSHHIAGHR